MARHGRGTRAEQRRDVMFDLSCLNRPPEPSESLLFADGFSIALVGILLLALSGSALASPFVQRAYRSRIVRLMRFNQVSPRPSQWWSSKASGARRSRNISVVGSESGGYGTDLLDLVSRRERRVAVSTTLAWFVFVLLALPIAQWVLADGSASDRAYFVVGAGVLALGPAYINLPPRFARRALVFGLIACALAAVLVVSLTSPMTADAVPQSDADDSEILEMVVGAVIVVLAYLSIFQRRLRGLVLPVFVVAAVALVLLLIPYGYLEPYCGRLLRRGYGAWAVGAVGAVFCNRHHYFRAGRLAGIQGTGWSLAFGRGRLVE